MATIGFHASHELFPPSALLRHMQQAERAGFAAGMCSDHFHPWTARQGHSGYSFVWLGAALQATGLSIGTICCPVFRYHPAVVAQAAATLAELFPDRFWLALGTGQALNEHIIGQPWPDKPERQAMVSEAAGVMRALWRGEVVTHRGKIRVEHARVFSLPERLPLLLGAATSPATAEWVASWADGLLTVNTDRATMQQVVDAFRGGGGEGKPMYLQDMVGYDPDEQRAWHEAAKNWPVAVLDQEQLQNLETPERMAAACGTVRPSDLKGKARVSSDPARHVAWLEDDLALGFDRIFLYTISGNAERFIDAYGEKVLPAFRTI
ncbi:MAG: TIGR03885 family FMN-dependent LLM class oxidoreductase [Pirellulaceae bacterium]